MGVGKHSRNLLYGTQGAKEQIHQRRLDNDSEWCGSYHTSIRNNHAMSIAWRNRMGGVEGEVGQLMAFNILRNYGRKKTN